MWFGYKGMGFSRVSVPGPLISGGGIGSRVTLILLTGKDSTKETGRNGKNTFGVIYETGSEKGRKNEDGGLVWTTKGTPGHTVRERESYNNI